MVRPLIEITGGDELPLLAIGTPAAPSEIASTNNAPWASLVGAGPFFDFADAGEDAGLFVFKEGVSVIKAVPFSFTAGVPSAGTAQTVSAGILTVNGGTSDQLPSVSRVPTVPGSYVVGIARRAENYMRLQVKEVSVAGGIVSNPSFAGLTTDLDGFGQQPSACCVWSLDRSDPQYWPFMINYYLRDDMRCGVVERTGVNTFSFAQTVFSGTPHPWHSGSIMPFYDHAEQSALRCYTSGSDLMSGWFDATPASSPGWAADNTDEIWSAGGAGRNYTLKIAPQKYLTWLGGGQEASEVSYPRLITPDFTAHTFGLHPWQGTVGSATLRSIFKLISAEEVEAGIYVLKIIQAEQQQITTEAVVRVRPISFKVDTAGGMAFAEAVGDWTEIETVTRTGDAGGNPFDIILPQQGAHDTAVLLFTGDNATSIRMSYFSVA